MRRPHSGAPVYSMVQHSRAFLVITVCAALSACGVVSNDKDSAASSEGGLKVALDWTSYVAYHAPLIVADEEGYFEDEGIETSFKFTAGSKEGALAVGTGKADIGWVDLSSAAAAMLTGVPIRAVATVQDKNASGLTALDDTTLAKADDVRGLKIGSTPGGSDSTLLPAFLKANGMDESDVTIVNQPANGKLPGLLGGDVDVISGQVYYYTASLAEEGEDASSLLYSDAGVKALDHGIVASQDFLDENPDQVTGFLTAYRRGLADTQDDPAGACEEVVARSDGMMSQDFCVAQLELWLELVPDAEASGWGTANAADWRETVEILQTYGGVKGSTSPQDMYTDTLLPKSDS